MRPAPANRTRGLDNPLMRDFQSMLQRPGIMSFGAGFMNPAGFDVAGVRAAFDAALADGEAGETLQYGMAEGSPKLRQAIVARMEAIGVSTDAAGIVVTTGATQALDLLCNALLDPGDTVLVERPTYVMPLQRFVLAQARVVSVAGDEDGLDPEALEAAVIEHRPKLLYSIPTFQNPGGTTLTAERRAEVARIAEKYGIWVIEDDPYRELRYGPAPPEPIAVHDPERVLYLGTLAKTVAPGLRVGWVAAPRDVVKLCTPVKQALDFNTSSIDQAAAAHYLEHVDWGRRTAELRGVYSVPMRSMLRALDDVLPAGSSYTRPGGGLFVWVELPGDHSVGELLQRAVEHGVFFMPGQLFLPDQPSDTTLRLSISNHTPESIERGMGRLSQALSDVAAERAEVAK